MTTKTFNVYYCTPVETMQAVIMPDYKPAIFDTLDEAKLYVEERVKGEEPVDPRDNTADNHNTNHWYEVYQGDPVNEDGEAQDAVYTSDCYYNKILK